MSDPRTRVPPSRGFDKHLFGYALAAGAGLLAGGQPANAGIVYVDPADVTYTNTSFSLDLNSDNVSDVHFGNYGGRRSWYKSGRQYRSAVRYVSWQAAAADRSPVPAGTTIGPGMAYTSGRMRSIYTRSTLGGSGSKWVNSVNHDYGPFLNGGDEYFGLQFTDGSKDLYGWVRLSGYTEVTSNTIAITIKDWAYDDAGNPIRAGDTGAGGAVPEPGTLGLLAFGAAGLAMLRARRKKRA